MSDPREILQLPEALESIDAALTRRSRRHRGWLLIDAESPELPGFVVHVRSWLQDPGAEKRFRVGTRLRRSSGADLAAGYGVVFLAGPDGLMDTAGYDRLAEALEKDLPHLVVRVETDGLAFSDGAGRWVELPPPRKMATVPLDLEVHGARTLREEVTLPFRIAVSSSLTQDSVHLRLVDRGGFRSTNFRFRLRAAGGVPLGRGVLRIDFDPEGPSDRLVVVPEGFVPAVEVVPQDSPRPARGRRFVRGVPLRLHLLFDRTTLDHEQWERAFAALTDVAPQVDDEFQAEDPRSNWNLQVRRGLANAMAGRLADLHDGVKLELWWFADMAQPGVAEPDNLPKSRTAWGHPGECALEKLADRLSGRVFGYATGMDLFDAVDEVLGQVASLTGSAQREQHAVLIVGDSPPPPADEWDPIWQELVERPLRTNARRSPAFRQHLEELTRRQVPVGWLFVRSSAPPVGRDLYLGHYPQFQTLRENTLAALKRMPDLMVQSCDGAEDFDRGLAELFRQMGIKPETPSRLEVGEPV